MPGMAPIMVLMPMLKAIRTITILGTSSLTARNKIVEPMKLAIQSPRPGMSPNRASNPTRMEVPGI